MNRMSRIYKRFSHHFLFCFFFEFESKNPKSAMTVIPFHSGTSTSDDLAVIEDCNYYHDDHVQIPHRSGVAINLSNSSRGWLKTTPTKAEARSAVVTLST